MVLSTANPYYFFVDEPLYVKNARDEYERATTDNYTGSEDVYYRSHVFRVSDNTSTLTYTQYDKSKGNPTLNTNNPDDNTYYIPEGTLRGAAPVTMGKTSNPTNTEDTVLVESAITYDAQNGYVGNQWLGNNGRIDMPIYGTLAITNYISKDDGFTLPPNPEMKYQIQIWDKDGHELTGANAYRAILRNSNEVPLNHDTHERMTYQGAAEDAKFYIKSGDTFTLRDDAANHQPARWGLLQSH